MLVPGGDSEGNTDLLCASFRSQRGRGQGSADDTVQNFFPRRSRHLEALQHSGYRHKLW